MKRSTKLFTLTTLFATALLTGCQTQSNTLTFTTPAPTSMFNTNNQTAMVNVATRDLRPSAEVASYTISGQISRLNALPNVAQMFQQAMQQNLNSKGFTLVQGAGNANVLVNIHKFYADVEQGNLRYKINANISIDVTVQGTKGNFSKNFTSTRSYEGAFGANNAEIQNVLNDAYSNIIQTLYNDNEIGNAIHQFK